MDNIVATTPLLSSEVRFEKIIEVKGGGLGALWFVYLIPVAAGYLNMLPVLICIGLFLGMLPGYLALFAIANMRVNK